MAIAVEDPIREQEASLKRKIQEGVGRGLTLPIFPYNYEGFIPAWDIFCLLQKDML